MLRLDKVIKPWKEAASLNDHINLYGFWNETAFLTKSGDVGMVLRVSGVDYESLDHAEQEYAVKRLEAALKAFGPGFHVYQYLFKQNRPEIPFAHYDDPIVEAAIDQRRQFFEAKRDRLYQVEIFYCVVLEGARSKTGVGAALTRLFRDPAGAMDELKTQFAGSSMKTLLRSQIEAEVAQLDQRVQAFTRQLGDFVGIEVLKQQGQFAFLRRLVNYDDWRIAGKPQSTQFLDYQVVNSTIEAERDHLRVGDHIVRVLTMKEAITETRPLVLDSLLKIGANFYVVTEWTPMNAEQARKEVNKRRRHFNVSKTGFISQMGNDAAQTNPRDVLVDESKQADIENLGDCLRALGDGQQLGDFSLSIVLYGRSKSELEQLVGEFTGIFTNADGNLFVETYNQLNAYFATVPGNYALNLRRLYLLNSNYADLSFLFTILPGEKTNPHLGSEYLAALETDNSTPYFLNLHNGEVEQLIEQLAGDLTRQFGRGFGRANLRQMRAFYRAWPDPQIRQTLSGEFASPNDFNAIGVASSTTSILAARFPLPWSAYVRLLSVKRPEARSFYENEALRLGWSVRQLDRQIGSQFYERIALSRNKAAMLQKADTAEPDDTITPEEAIKDPFVLEFLELKDEYSESDLEEALIQHLTDFLLELGDDFAFVGRQRRVRIDDNWFRVDLVFFHRRLKSLLIVDLKIDRFSHADAGQMHMYLNYAREHWMKPGENPPVGLILCAEKGATEAHYALDNLPNKILAAEYQTILPDEKIIADELERSRQRLEERQLSGGRD